MIFKYSDYMGGILRFKQGFTFVISMEIRRKYVGTNWGHDEIVHVAVLLIHFMDFLIPKKKNIFKFPIQLKSLVWHMNGFLKKHIFCSKIACFDCICLVI